MTTVPLPATKSTPAVAVPAVTVKLTWTGTGLAPPRVSARPWVVVPKLPSACEQVRDGDDVAHLVRADVERRADAAAALPSASRAMSMP